MALSFFLRLMLGHVIGDFFLQPYWLVLAKRSGWKGLLIHVGVVTFITAVFVWASIPNWWVWIIALFLGHLFIDQFRTFVFTDNSKGKGLLLLFLDQLAHVLLIVLLAWLAIGWTWADLAPLTTSGANQGRMIVYLIGLTVMISVVPVLEAEVTVAVLAMLGTEITHTVAIITADRVLGGLERIIGAALILVGFGLIAPLVFIPRLAYMINKGQLKTDKPGVITKVATSFISTLIVALILLQVPFPTIGLF
ncbi:MAG: DUF3307 domain-containing protein [Anaerolineae bacterium]|nr:DUF3307 domain-containing protein [Anaerolineae bacterium]